MTRPENQRTFLGALVSTVISAPFWAFAQPAECELQLIRTFDRAQAPLLRGIATSAVCGEAC